MPSFAQSLEKTLHAALQHATDRTHEYATLEHLLLALVDLGQFGAMAARFQTLPLSIPLHVIGTGEVMRIASRTSLLLIPALGSFVTLINGLVGAIVHARERVGAYLLLAAAVLVHVVTLLALGGVLG